MNPLDGWRSALKRCLPVVLWAGIIFNFSTETFSFANTEGFLSESLDWFFPSIAPAQLNWLHAALRKCGHWFEYFVLALLLLRAQRRDDEPELAAAAIARTLALVLAYAVSDEVHQLFVPQRSASATPTIPRAHRSAARDLIGIPAGNARG